MWETTLSFKKKNFSSMSFAERGEVKHAYRMDEIEILEDEKKVQILDLPQEHEVDTMRWCWNWKA